jgi:2,3,4,5-tetrahydropyridine-2-carboxylate N-succinyltransferase
MTTNFGLEVSQAGIDILLGDECLVEAGSDVIAGIKAKTTDGKLIAARELSRISGLLFRRNSQTDVVEAIVTDASKWDGLNDSLYSND